MASPRPSVQSFRKHLVCPECEQLYQNPRLLPCLDSVCERCVQAHPVQVEEQAVEAGPEIPHENFHCPRECCKKEYNIGGQQVTDNRFLSNLIETLQLETALSEGSRVKCESCLEPESAVVVCLDADCRQTLCQRCRDYHKNNQLLQHHALLEVGVLCQSQCKEAVPKVQASIPPKAWECYKPHPRAEKIQLYCHEHEEVICHVCATVSHAECAYHHRLTDVFDGEGEEDPKLEMQQTVDQLKAMNEVLARAMENIQNIRGDLARREEEVKADINRRHEEVIESLNEQRDRLIAKTENIHRTKATVLDNHLEFLGGVHENIAHSLEFIEDSLAISSQVEFYFLKRPFERRMEELESIFNDAYKTPHENAELGYAPDPLGENTTLYTALGNVESTPTVGHFTVDTLEDLEVGNKSLITISCRDPGDNKLRDCNAQFMPSLEAKLFSGAANVVNPAEAQDGAIICDVAMSAEGGVYAVTAIPQYTGPHQLYVYCKRPNPFPVEFINRGVPVNVRVVRPVTILPFRMHNL